MFGQTAIATFLPVGVNVDAAKTKQMQFRFQQQLQGKSITYEGPNTDSKGQEKSTGKI